MNFKFFETKSSRRLRKAIHPRKEFIRAAKESFLSAFDARYGGVARAPHFGFAAKMSLAGLIVAGSTLGVSVYADTHNVAADSPLYAFKRLHEAVQLTFAASETKSQLRVTFAARRANEIDDLAARHPSSTLIKGLSKDFNEDVTNSVKEVDSHDLKDDQLGVFCDQIFAIVGASSSAAQTEFSLHPEILAQLGDRCANVASTSVQDDNNENKPQDEGFLGTGENNKDGGDHRGGGKEENNNDNGIASSTDDDASVVTPTDIVATSSVDIKLQGEDGEHGR